MQTSEPWSRKDFNKKILDATYKYQKIYGFQIGSGAHATYNNEADAFKHAFMQAYLSLRFNRTISKSLGDFHELETPKAPKRERNMDLWNNSIGREVANDIKNSLGKDIKYYSLDELNDIAAAKIMKIMKEGELITNPDDKREFKNIRFERLKDNERVLYRGEYDKFNLKDRERYKDIFLNQVIDNNWKLPTQLELNSKVLNGELIYVNSYKRADGTNVSGYYRRKLIQ